MSTALILHALENGGGFSRYTPRFRGAERERRRLTVPADIAGWIKRPEIDPEKNEWKIAVRAQLKQFVIGGPVDDCEFIKRVADYRVASRFASGVWAIGVRFLPQYRFFGMFPLPDWFIIFDKQKRDQLDGPDKWHAELDASTRAWDANFQGRFPYPGLVFSDFVTHNSEHCDDRWYPISAYPGR